MPWNIVRYFLLFGGCSFFLCPKNFNYVYCSVTSSVYFTYHNNYPNEQRKSTQIKWLDQIHS
jgi:hypothetical protein